MERIISNMDVDNINVDEVNIWRYIQVCKKHVFLDGTLMVIHKYLILHINIFIFVLAAVL